MKPVRSISRSIPDLLDHSKPTVKLLASEKIGKDLYRQIHLVRFVKKTGEPVSAITVNEALHQECSTTEADVYEDRTSSGDFRHAIESTVKVVQDATDRQPEAVH